MANFKLSQLQELNNITEEQANGSYIMVVANDETGKLKNFRIKLSELSKFVETGGVVQESITPDEVAQMISTAIRQHEKIEIDGSTITIPEKIEEVHTTLTDVTGTITDIKDTTDAVVQETLEIKSTVNSIETISNQAITKATNAVNTVKTIQTDVEQAVTKVDEAHEMISNIQEGIEEAVSKVDTIESTVTETSNKVEEVHAVVTDVQTLANTNNATIIQITEEIEILKNTTPTIDSVTEEHADEIFNECFGI